MIGSVHLQVLELTTFRGVVKGREYTSDGGWTPWRTARLIALGLDIDWQTKLIETHHVAVPEVRCPPQPPPRPMAWF